MEVRQLFKQLVHESKYRSDVFANRRGWTILGKKGKTMSDWFSYFGDGDPRNGKYSHLTPEYIDTADIKVLTDEMLLFISDSLK